MKKGTKITAGYNEFRYEFDLFDGLDPGKLSFDDTNVVEYEFINQGNTLCIINDGLRLYPAFANIEPSRWKGTINDFENDTTIYRYKFEKLDLRGFVFNAPPGGAGDFLSVPFVSNVDPGELFKDFGRLLVITKVKAKL